MTSSAIIPAFDPALTPFYIRSANDAAWSLSLATPPGQGTMSSQNRITYSTADRRVDIDGTADDDRVHVRVVDGQTLRVNFIGVETADFAIDDVDAIQFLARGGDDFFNNNSSIQSWAFGHDGNDHLIGGFDADFLNGGNGNDRLVGRGGMDGLRGMAGDDEIHGGSETDYLYGGNGHDLITGDAGGDFIYGDAGNDTMYGGNGNDRIWGWTGKDFAAGQNGSDHLYGQQAADELHGNDGQDVINGGSHDDVLFGGNHYDRLSGENGRDTISGNAGNNWISGGQNADLIYGGQHDDQVFGGAGDDSIFGNAGNDVLRGESGSDQIAGGAGQDTLFGGAHDDTLTGNEGNDILRGEDGNDLLNGSAGRDWLYGGNGQDTLLGGQDQLPDTLNGNAGQDHVLYRPQDIVQGSGSADLRLEFQSLTSLWTEAEILVINKGLELLHRETNNSRLVTDYLTGEDLTLQKVATLPGNGVAQNVLTIRNRNGVTTYSRVIKFAEWNEHNQYRNRLQPYIFIHEISHNWDSAEELTAAPGVGPQQWVNFKALSNWRDRNPNNQNYLQSTDGQWWYHRSTQFARSYGKTNPYEDWGTLWEYYFEDPEANPPPNSNLAQKRSFLINFFGRLKS